MSLTDYVEEVLGCYEYVEEVLGCFDFGDEILDEVNQLSD